MAVSISRKQPPKSGAKYEDVKLGGGSAFINSPTKKTVDQFGPGKPVISPMSGGVKKQAVIKMKK